MGIREGGDRKSDEHNVPLKTESDLAELEQIAGIRQGSAGKVAKGLEETEFPPNVTQADLAENRSSPPEEREIVPRGFKRNCTNCR